MLMNVGDVGSQTKIVVTIGFVLKSFGNGHDAMEISGSRKRYSVVIFTTQSIETNAAFQLPE